MEVINYLGIRMKKEFEHLALLAGGSHYPQVGGENLSLFGRLVVEECIDVIDARTIAEEHTDWETGYNAALKKVVFDLRMKYGIE
jgi:hypothetical protein